MTSRASHPRRALAALAVLACGTSLAACGSRTSEGESGESGAKSDPVAAVRDFVASGVLDHNGYQACVNLTTAEQRKIMRRVRVGECREAFDRARLALDGKQIQTVHQVEQLPARVTRTGKRADVRLGSGKSSADFGLVTADRTEQNEFLAPDTEWRIARGALPLVPKGR
jgi:hypothetical protein